MKQFARIGQRTVFELSVAAARSVSDGVVAVVPGVAGQEVAGQDVTGQDVAGADACITGGDTRSESVRRGLSLVPEDARIVLVHDAARPLATPELFSRAVAGVEGGAAAVVPVVPVTDSLRRYTGGPVDREGLLAVQTPQAFLAAALRDAHAKDGEATDDASLVEAGGTPVTLVDGERWNLKITTREDLVVAEALLAERGTR